MKTLLVYMVLVNRTWLPTYAMEFASEKECLAHEVQDTRWNSTSKAMCIPMLKQERK